MSRMVWDAPKWRARSSDGAPGALREQFEPATRAARKLGEAYPGRRRCHDARGVAPMLAETAESLARTAGAPKGISLDERLTFEEAVSYLKMTPKAFEKVVARGGIPKHYLTERGILFSRTELDQWLPGR